MRFEKNPELEIVDSESVIKNFGATMHEDPTIADEAEEMGAEYQSPGIFEGDINSDRAYYKEKLWSVV